MTPIIDGAEKIGTRLSIGRPKVAVAEYDFAVDGGATGSKTLRGDTIPAGAIVIDSLVVVKSKLESGGEATVLLTIESEGDLQASKKVSEGPWSTATPKRGAVTATGTPVVPSVKRSVVAKVGTASLTAGKFKILVWYLEVA